MASIEIMTTGRIELSASGRAVAANVARLRTDRGWSLRKLSEALVEVGRGLSQDAINKIENGAKLDDPRYAEKPPQIRRVDVDDLVALAVVFNVNPNTLLLPAVATGRTEVTGVGVVDADRAWDWAEGERPLNLPDGDDGTAHNQFQTDARPAGRRKFVMATGPARPTSDALAAIEADRLRYEKETGESVDPDTFRRLWMQARLGVKPEGGSDG